MRSFVLPPVLAVLGSIAAAAVSFQPAWTPVRGSAAPDTAITHGRQATIRLEGDGRSDLCARSGSLRLVVGRRYELSGWVRTDQLEVHGTNRSRIAIGAALALASMPFDVHSESLGGTRDWNRLTLRFIATRPEDSILLTAGNGGTARGKAWFSGVSIDEVSSEGEWPVRAAVRTFGPAYRYPNGGWIYLHIEGKPYERGYQHGFLMAREIETYLDRCAARLDSKSKTRAWRLGRTTADALFLRGFDAEIREEMKGIAEGAAAAGAKCDGRPVDLIDILAANTITELGELQAAMPMTPTGLEGLHLSPPAYFDRKRDVAITERCSAFAATGKATRDGKMHIAHITMWPLTLAEQTNIMLDLQPVSGHRVLMQSYPGGIQSGTDWYQNDAGVVLTETTIRQSPFNVQGTPVAFRARQAIQYGDNVDKVVEYLGARNNGLYTNEWLIGDAHTNEIAMYELGTYKTRLWRSSKNQWFGGTEGFYWGCNNAKDLNVRLEYAPDPQGAPAHLPYIPADRDLKWVELYNGYMGAIDEQFAFTAFRTAPLVTPTSMDAKVTNSDMASHMLVWAVFGKPNQREWVPSPGEKQEFPANDGLYSSGYRLFAAQPSDSLRSIVAANEQQRLAAKPPEQPAKPKTPDYKDRLWKGWVLPASDADRWFTAGATAYYYDLLSPDDFDKKIECHRAAYRAALLASPDAMTRAALDAHGGALRLDAWRRSAGDDRFFEAMKNFFAANTTRTVKAPSFVPAAPLPVANDGPAYVPANIRPMSQRLASAILVYGTGLDAGANRFAAEQLRRRFLDFYESEVPLRKDFEVAEEDLHGKDVIFIGRPETNSVLRRWSGQLGLKYSGAAFSLGAKDHGAETEGLILAAANPLDPKHLVVVIAGNSALETVKLASVPLPSAQYAVFQSATEVDSGFLK